MYYLVVLVGVIVTGYIIICRFLNSPVEGCNGLISKRNGRRRGPKKTGKESDPYKCCK
jgi:hypothetical protein